MCKYKRPIEATNISKISDQLSPDTADLTSLSLGDGMIYGFGQMNKPQKINGMEQPALKVKVLVCICMYN